MSLISFLSRIVVAKVVLVVKMKNGDDEEEEVARADEADVNMWSETATERTRSSKILILTLHQYHPNEVVKSTTSNQREMMMPLILVREVEKSSLQDRSAR